MPARRLFVAVELSHELRDALDRVQENIRPVLPNVRWVKGEGLHATLQFLGATDETLIKEISAALSEAGNRHAPFEAACAGFGVFPNVKRASVVWAGIEQGGHAMESLALDARKALLPFGLPVLRRGFPVSERGDFTPHVTLGRIRGGERPDILEREIAAHRGKTFGAFQVRSFALFESRLRPDGAEYAVLARFSLRRGHGFT